MISVQEALRILRDNIPTPRREMVGLDQAYYAVLFEDMRAPESSPRYTNSAMDGFAVRWSDCRSVADGSEVRLQIVGESQAGVPFSGELSAGTAIRINTGAMVPPGADTVVRVEDTSEADGSVIVRAVRALGQDVRVAGEEFEKGELLFSKGRRLGSRELALLAAVGLDEIPVYAKPKVSLLVTGTELAPPTDKDIEPHQIRDSNSIMLKSAVLEAGGLLQASTHVEDSLEHTIERVDQACRAGADLILCSGGVSVGRHDHVKDAALAAGFTELFWKIRQKPGKPLFVCRRNDTLLFGLPGNPVSAFMCFNNYVRPVLTQLQGITDGHPFITARSTGVVENRGKRTNFIRVRVETIPNEIAQITEISQQGSHMLSSIVHADGYIVLQPGVVLEPGSLIEVFLF